ncbi:MAG: SpoIID/LytB domain-containing protein [Bacteroidales bacterium]|nr:SpoIID/LytB domain-containing protein [Bacteroidales bacterium]
MNAPEISVGIVSGSELSFTLNGKYTCKTCEVTQTGKHTARISNGRIIIVNGEQAIEAEEEVTFTPEEGASSGFTLHAVTIGVNFHWQRDEDQSFTGKLKFIIEEGKLTAVNILSVEDYLLSVISSEMSATSSSELLKAHAVISRSWLLAQMDKTAKLKAGAEKYTTTFITGKELTKWYDREDHSNFDVCADDHCQRYQGITMASTPEVEHAINETYGLVLMHGGAVCDARFYKCCGGITELFENVWEPVSHPYLQMLIDNDRMPAGFETDLTREENAVMWIKGNPPAFCNTNDREILSQVLNSYDQETSDFFRWKVSYTQQELSDLVRSRSGIDFGLITDLEPLSRGVSGRIIRLKIKGDKRELIIGKELEIRKSLSKSHLYSSAFYVEKSVDATGARFILHGAGWGHGAGLCQIGAAVMGARGYSYEQILMHYFKNAYLKKIY